MAMVYVSVPPRADLHGEQQGACAFLFDKAFAAKHFRVGVQPSGPAGGCAWGQGLFSFEGALWCDQQITVFGKEQHSPN